jgi:hypothetical protein
MDATETVTTLKGLASLGSGVVITFMVMFVLVQHILPFFERAINNTLRVHQDSLNAIIKSYDNFMEKVVANMEKGLSSLAEDIRELRRELRQDLHDRAGEKKGENK